MNNYWRIQAKHTTVCPRCRGYIKIGTVIVREDGYASGHMPFVQVSYGSSAHAPTKSTRLHAPKSNSPKKG